MRAIEPVRYGSAVAAACGQTTRLLGHVALRPELDGHTRDAMYRLLSGHFIGAERATFEADLAEKQYAILLEDEEGELRGFSTLLLYTTEAPGRKISVVYSGDTIVDRAWWGSPVLARTWIHTVRQLRAASADVELYWLLLTSGYRTYRFLPVFFRSFYPMYAGTSPDEMGTVLEAVAAERFGSRYDATTGIVRLAKPQVLAPDLLELPDRRTVDPHVAYFLARNPGHVRGDELACLTMIADDNLTPAGRRMARDAPER